MSGYRTLYLRFDNAAAAQDALPWLWDADASEWRLAGDGWAFDPIGTLYTLTGESDADGIPLQSALPGWHANLRCTGEIARRVPRAYRVEPDTPSRDFA